MANKFAFIKLTDVDGKEYRVNPFFVSYVKPDYTSNTNAEGERTFKAVTLVQHGPAESIYVDMTIDQIERAIFNSGYPMAFIRLPWDGYELQEGYGVTPEIQEHLKGDSLANVEMMAVFSKEEGRRDGPEYTRISFVNEAMLDTEATVQRVYNLIEAVQGYARQSSFEQVQSVIVQSIQTGGAIHRAMKK